jgi:hypothetical protein
MPHLRAIQAGGSGSSERRRERHACSIDGNLTGEEESQQHRHGHWADENGASDTVAGELALDSAAACKRVEYPWRAASRKHGYLGW